MLLFVLVWKVSVIWTDFSLVIKNPVSLLYFSGGAAGIYIGAACIALRNIYEIFIKKHDSNVHSNFLAYIWFYSMYLVLLVLLNRSNYLDIIVSMAAAAGFIGIGLRTKQAELANGFVPMIIVYGAIIYVQFGTLWNTYMLTSVLFGLLLIVVARKEGIELSKKAVSLAVIAMMFGMLLSVVYDQVRTDSNGNLLAVGSADANGKLAPDFTAQTIEGISHSLKDYRGKKVILNFWASWCPPCKAEMPHLQKYYDNYRDLHNVEIVSVNLTYQDTKRSKIKALIDKNKLSFPVFLDEDSSIASSYGVRIIPTTFIIDENGLMSRPFTGPLSEAMIIQLMDK